MFYSASPTENTLKFEQRSIASRVIAHCWMMDLIQVLEK